MSSRIVHDCDRCGVEIQPGMRFSLVLAVACGIDGSGSNSADYEEVDLCPSCCSMSLTALIGVLYGKYDYEGNKSLVKALTDKTGQAKFGRPGSVEAANGR